MQEQAMILSQAIQQAIRNGKSQDAIAAYTQAILEGISLKFNFEGMLSDNKPQDSEPRKNNAPPKTHAIIEKSNFTIRYISKMLDRKSSLGGKEKEEKVSLKKVVMNLPAASLEGGAELSEELVFFEKPKKEIDGQGLFAMLSQYYRSQKLL